MINSNHPITPPPELVQKLAHERATWLEKFSEAYCAGADQELEACCEWLVKNFLLEPRGKSITNLRAARRPKPPSLKEQALEALKHAEEGWRPVPADCAIIRRALESLPD